VHDQAFNITCNENLRITILKRLLKAKMDNPEQLATRRRKTKQKHNTIYVGHHYIQANTKNVNKTRAHLQTTGICACCI
jgi:hypothetical protein